MIDLLGIPTNWFKQLFMNLIYTALHYEGKWEGFGPWKSRLLGPVKWHRAVRRVPFGPKKSPDFQGPTPSHLHRVA